LQIFGKSPDYFRAISHLAFEVKLQACWPIKHMNLKQACIWRMICLYSFHKLRDFAANIVIFAFFRDILAETY